MNKQLILTAFAGVALTGMAATVTAECNVEAGRKVFNKCVACHSLEPDVHMMGPSLHGVFGRVAGSVESFAYSAALQDADFIWDAETLSAFLEQPMTYLPGTTMPFGGIRKAEQRGALSCLLESTR